VRYTKKTNEKNSKHGLLSEGNSIDSISAWVKHGNYALEYGQNVVCGHADDEDDMAVFRFVCVIDVYKCLIVI